MPNEMYLHAIQEMMFDWNSEFLLDLHADLKEQYAMLGIMANSKSHDFVHCILANIQFYPINGNNIYIEDDDSV